MLFFKVNYIPIGVFGLKVLIEQQRVIFSACNRILIQPGMPVGYIPKRYACYYVAKLTEYSKYFGILSHLLLLQFGGILMRFTRPHGTPVFFPGIDRYIKLGYLDL